jgi:hypothetical protein
VSGASLGESSGRRAAAIGVRKEVALRSGSYFASLAVAAVASLAFLPLSCSVQQPQTTTYFDSTISPILTAGCVRPNTGTGCHASDAKGNAFGNLDLSSFDGVNRRRDLLQTYGPYPRPSLLLKTVPPITVTMQTFDGATIKVLTDIKHAGADILDPIQTGASTLTAWIANGATQFNTGPTPPMLAHYPCTDVDPDPSKASFNESTFFTASINHNAPDYQMFVASSGPNSIIQSICGSGNCHGTPSNELYFLCGNDQQQKDWNYFTASQYVSNPPRNSEILRRPLDPSQGGSFHEGGVIFSGPSDPNYVAFEDWAVKHGPSKFSSASPNLLFFAHRVQPMLVKKGCMMLQCHSAAMFHDYKLRGGSGGSFSYAATVKNYQLSLAQLGTDSLDFNASRIARKNLFRPEVAANPIAAAGTPGDDAGAGPALPQALGITHRGGPLFEDFQNEVTGAVCAAGAKPPFTDCCPATGTPTPNIYDTLLTADGTDIPIPAYCMFKEWHARERAHPVAGPAAFNPLSEIVYVKRPPQTGPDRAQDFDVFAGGAELHIAQVTPKTNAVLWVRDKVISKDNFVPEGVLTTVNGLNVGTDKTVSVSTLCGLGAQPDIRRPMVSWDATKIAFAARSAAGDPLTIYEINAAGTTCQKLPLNTVTYPSQCSTGNGMPVHNFDPAYAPDGSIVFASTRGNLPFAQDNFSYCGPQMTPADPSKPNSNLYVYNPTSGTTTQLTYLLNMERHPSLMLDGRAIFTTEKREPNFYQLALRRQNLDTGDYHPLFAQRGSIGYYQADQVVEMSDKNFAAIFSTCLPGKPGATPTCAQHGGGVLATFNRSIGVDFTSENKADYPIDPTVIPIPEGADSIDPAFFFHSLRIPPLVASWGTSGTPGKSGYLYTTPSPIPGGTLLVSRSTAKADPGTFDGQYDLCVVDPETGFAEVIVPGGGDQVVEAVAVYQRFVRGPSLPSVFASALDEPNGHTSIVPGQISSEAVYLDAKVLTSLFFQNTPTGRLMDTGLTNFDIYEELPPDQGVTSFSSASSTYVAQDDFGSVWVKRRLLGNVSMASDASAHVTLPGGLPIVFHLPDTPLSMQKMLPRWQREEVEYSPGEVLNQSMPADSINSTFGPSFFNSLCGQCHSSISGRFLDVAVNPDILTQASIVAGRTESATNLNIPPTSRSTTYVPASQIQ